MWSSPEVIMETPWNTATDIWSFGAVVSGNHHFGKRSNADACSIAAYQSNLWW
jgi:hypothetical protein